MARSNLRSEVSPGLLYVVGAEEGRHHRPAPVAGRGSRDQGRFNPTGARAMAVLLLFGPPLTDGG
eukprot:10650664-Prorocentrum_lima.AAC.1